MRRWSGAAAAVVEAAVVSGVGLAGEGVWGAWVEEDCGSVFPVPEQDWVPVQ